MGGWIRLYRSLSGHCAFNNDAEAMAFGWLILKAQWQPAKVRYKGRKLCLQRGEVAMSVRDMARAMKRDKGWVERLLKCLEAEAMISTVTETGVSVITICNYDEYQGSVSAAETAHDTVYETRARRCRDTEQEVQESKKEERKPFAAARELPPDWRPGTFEPDTAAHRIESNWSSERRESELERFRSYHHRKGTRYAEWQGAWAGWIRNAQKFDKRDDRGRGERKPAATPPRSHADIVLERARIEGWDLRKPEESKAAPQ